MTFLSRIVLFFGFSLIANAGIAQIGLVEPKLEFAFEAVITLDPAQDLGITTYGKRRQKSSQNAACDQYVYHIF